MNPGEGVPRRFRVVGDMVFETVGGDADALRALAEHFAAMAVIVKSRAEGRQLGETETLNVTQTQSLRVVRGGIRVDRYQEGPSGN